MVKQLNEVTELQVIQNAIKRQNEQGNQLEIIVTEMIKLKTDVMEEVADMRQLVSDVKDEIQISYEQQKTIQSIVQSKANTFTEIYYADGYGQVESKYHDELFKKKKGQFIQALYKRLKTHFNTPRYTSIRKVDFENAKQFLLSIEYRYIASNELKNKASWNIPNLVIGED